MPLSNFQKYPRGFNEWGHLKIMPITRPERVSYRYYMYAGAAIYLGIRFFNQFIFTTFN